MRSLDLVHDYFDRAAERFDAIYESDKPLHQRVGDALFRQVIHERFKFRFVGRFHVWRTDHLHLHLRKAGLYRLDEQML